MTQPERNLENLDALSEETIAEVDSQDSPSVENDPEWAGLLQYLLEARGFDFHGYKPASLARRIRKRMDGVKLDSFAAYQEYLEVHPTEFVTLFNTILINVTGFFRDPAAWEIVRTKAIPQIVSSKTADEPIRVWSAGCATGEEACTIAMLLAEELGDDGFRHRVKIYATDVDEEALDTARHAAYSERQIEDVPPEYVDRYFEHVDGLYLFRKDFRRSIIFGRHDLINDAPISRIDLLTCRNTLMYLNGETQARVLSRLHFALNDGGFLLLGRAETLMAHGHSFVAVDLKRRLSRKGARRSLPDLGFPERERRAGALMNLDSHLQIAALEASPVAQLVVDAAGQVVIANDRARDLFALRHSDVGRPLRDLPLSYRPLELRSLIERAEAERRNVGIKEIEWHTATGELRWLDLQIAPLTDGPGSVLGTVLTFSDSTAYRRLQRELEQSNQELETAYEELQSTNEELETTNEELQSTVEELETTNEELQSTNEELETMNEELQSTNEELQTMNDELRNRSTELNSSNAFLEAVFTSLRAAVVVLDRDLRIQVWNAGALDLWGVRPEEAQSHSFFNLDIGLPVGELHVPIRDVLSGGAAHREVVLDATNRKGRQIRCRVTCPPLRGPTEEMQGAILHMEEQADGAG